MPESGAAATVTILQGQVSAIIAFHNYGAKTIVDYPQIKVTGKDGEIIPVYTDSEWMEAKADKIVDTQMSNQALAAYVNNDLKQKQPACCK